jgi:3',5'-cyclic-AMP phosphodiesterase
MPRVLHFTDAHLRWNQPGSADNPLRLSRQMPDVLARLADKIKELRPDVVVMTGDLLDVPDDVLAGAPADGRPLEVWRAEIDADFWIFRDWFESLGVPYLSVPGNHDDEDGFRRVFDDPPLVNDIAGMRFFSFWDQLGPDRQPRRAGDQRNLYDAALTDAEHATPQIHLQHYMIDPPIHAKGWDYEYKGAAEMKQSMETSGRVRAVLSGHHHPGSLATGAGGLIHSLPPAFCEAPHPFRVYDIGEVGAINVRDLDLRN